MFSYGKAINYTTRNIRYKIQKLKKNIIKLHYYHYLSLKIFIISIVPDFLIYVTLIIDFLNIAKTKIHGEPTAVGTSTFYWRYIKTGNGSKWLSALNRCY